MEEEVKLHGFWASPFSHRVIWALKLKGVKYEYIEEDLSKKSELLLQYNPVHKKIPVLVHQGKPIAESLIILEYIEETWPENPLLPTDAYERAMARFWINFLQQKGIIFNVFLLSSGEEQMKAIKKIAKMLKIIEKQGLEDKKFFGGDTISLVDISYGFFAHWFEGIEEEVGIKLLIPGILPSLHAWTKNFRQIHVIKENLPDREKMLAYMKSKREKFFQELSNLK